MRIIGGQLKGKKIFPPKGLPVRPTMDIAKEAIFNYLRHHLEIAGATVLDLFTGTGNMSYEFASRGADKVTAVDMNAKCVSYVKKMAQELELNILVQRRDVFKYVPKITEQFDIVFADPPYMEKAIATLPDSIIQSGILHTDGLLIVEHGDNCSFVDHPQLVEVKTYGNTCFSIFEPPVS